MILVTERLCRTSWYRFTLAFPIRILSLHPFNTHCTICGHLFLRLAFGWLTYALFATNDTASTHFATFVGPHACRIPFPFRSCFGIGVILVTSRLSRTSWYRFTLALSIRVVSLHPFNHCTICGHLSPRFAIAYTIPILGRCFGIGVIVVTERLSRTSWYRFTLAFSIRIVSLHPFNIHCTICGHLSPRSAIAVTACFLGSHLLSSAFP